MCMLKMVIESNFIILYYIIKCFIDCFITEKKMLWLPSFKTQQHRKYACAEDISKITGTFLWRERQDQIKLINLILYLEAVLSVAWLPEALGVNYFLGVQVENVLSKKYLRWPLNGNIFLKISCSEWQ